MFACILALHGSHGERSASPWVFEPEQAHGEKAFAVATPVPPMPSSLLRLAFSFSPRIEPIPPDAVIVDMDGLERLFGPPAEVAHKIMQQAAESNLQVNVAVAANTQTAIYAARGLGIPRLPGAFAGITIIQPRQEASTLSKLPLDLLPAPPEMQDTWKLWGLKTFGDFAALPETGVAERLGPEGARLHRIARGAEVRPLIPFIPDIDFHVSQELEYPVELLDPLSFILAGLLHQLCASLEARGLAVSDLQLQLKLENPPENVSPDLERRLSFPVPLRDSTALLKLLRLDLEAHPPQAPVIAASLRATPAKPRATQNSLFIPPAPEPQKLELTLARITKLIGEGNAGSPALVDTHRPGAFEMQSFCIRNAGSHGERFSRRGLARPGVSSSSPLLSFRAFRPPLPAAVECREERPLRIRARGIQGEVVSCAGPWRTSGDWWTADPWQHDEWDVELAPLSRSSRAEAVKERVGPRVSQPYLLAAPAAQLPKTLYRVYRDLQCGTWYVEGSYD